MYVGVQHERRCPHVSYSSIYIVYVGLQQGYKGKKECTCKDPTAPTNPHTCTHSHTHTLHTHTAHTHKIHMMHSCITCVYMNPCTHTHTCVHIPTYTHIHMNTHIYTPHPSTHTCTCTYTCTCTSTHAHTQTQLQ